VRDSAYPPSAGKPAKKPGGQVCPLGALGGMLSDFQTKVKKKTAKKALIWVTLRFWRGRQALWIEV